MPQGRWADILESALPGVLRSICSRNSDDPSITVVKAEIKGQPLKHFSDKCASFGRRSDGKHLQELRTFIEGKQLLETDSKGNFIKLKSQGAQKLVKDFIVPLMEGITDFLDIEPAAAQRELHDICPNCQPEWAHGAFICIDKDIELKVKSQLEPLQQKHVCFMPEHKELIERLLRVHGASIGKEQHLQVSIHRPALTEQLHMVARARKQCGFQDQGRLDHEVVEKLAEIPELREKMLAKNVFLSIELDRADDAERLSLRGTQSTGDKQSVLLEDGLEHALKPKRRLRKIPQGSCSSSEDEGEFRHDFDSHFDYFRPSLKRQQAESPEELWVYYVQQVVRPWLVRSDDVNNLFKPEAERVTTKTFQESMASIITGKIMSKEHLEELFPGARWRGKKEMPGARFRARWKTAHADMLESISSTDVIDTLYGILLEVDPWPHVNACTGCTPQVHSVASSSVSSR